MAAATVDSMGTQFADPSFAGMEEEVEYNCQGCGLVLEEGKAFELAGLRWHIECFKCNTCGTLLDSDANLLLLGDGSLICNNCTYSCSACGNKIEDLAILTGEQAYCAGCFKCRNCKRKIENLRYARTSQGMFCMDCHDALMARRRKKHRNAQKQQRQAGNTDKSLPSLPPTVVLPESHFSPDLDSTPSQSYNGTPPVQQGTASELDSGSASLPPSRYNLNGNSKSADEDYIPMSLDPNVAATSPSYQELPAGRSSDRGYFDRRQHPLRMSSKEPPSNENSRPDTPSSYRGESPHPGKLSKPDGRTQHDPHRPSISTQSTRTLSNIDSSTTSESAWMAKTLERIDTSELPTPTSTYSPGLPRTSDAGLSPLQKESRRQPSIQLAELDSTPISSPVDSLTPGLAIGDPSSIASSSRGLQRDNSITLAPLQLIPTNSSQTQTIHRKEVPGPIKSSTEPNSAVSTSSKKSELSNFPLPPSTKTPYETPTLHHRTPSTSYEQLPPTNANGGLLISKPMESPLSKSFLDIGSSGGEDGNAGFTSPRAPPEVPKGGKHRAQSSSVGTIRSDFMGLPGSPTLSKFPKGSGTPDDGLGTEGGFLRRMSNSVRHSRSHSDRGGRSSGNHSKLGKSLAPPLPESPSVTSLPEQTAEIAWLRQELQMERAKITERDSRISELEGAADNRSNIRRMNTELREKRSTMVVLDTQKEIVFRELEALTQQMMSAKASPANMDLNRVSTSILREFGESLQRLRDSFAPQIEDLMEKKNDLSDELLKLAANKEKALEEFERLSIRNSQLMESNSSLTGSLNDLNRTSTTPTPQQSAVQLPPQIPEISRLRPTGLGIQQQPPTIQHQEHFVTNLAPEPRPSIAESNFTGTTLTSSAHADAEVNDAFLVQPQVVNIRKGQPKKTFNWKKGVQGVKGLKAAFSSSEYNNMREQTPTTPSGLVETIPYGSTTAAETPTTIHPGAHKAMLSSSDAQKRGFNLFDSSQKSKTATGRLTPNGASTGNADPSVLFGTELEARVRYEGVAIPLIITACVQEVEMRGMDIEGIYRKSGGTGSIEIIKDSFERNTDIDISNPDLDINAVTSTLKQYFRKLPTPLITYSVYDELLATETVPSVDGRIHAIRAALADLPRSHLDVLEFLIFHLHKVSQSEKVNLMTPMNCAVVFAPTIMRPESITREMTDTNTKNSVVQFMIEHVSDVFNKN